MFDVFQCEWFLYGFNKYSLINNFSIKNSFIHSHPFEIMKIVDYSFKNTNRKQTFQTFRLSLFSWFPSRKWKSSNCNKTMCIVLCSVTVAVRRNEIVDTFFSVFILFWFMLNAKNESERKMASKWQAVMANNHVIFQILLAHNQRNGNLFRTRSH